MRRKKSAAVPMPSGLFGTTEPIAEVKAFAERIGGYCSNFCRVVVTIDQGKYYSEKASFTIGLDGSIATKCEDPALLPTEDERAAIARGMLSAVNIPKTTEASEAEFAQLKSWFAQHMPDSILYPCWQFSGERESKKVLMVHERRPDPAKVKQYHPWTLMSENGKDNKGSRRWYRMEPSGALPFYKPRTKINNKIMVHEGAKAALGAASVKPDHPWFKELQQYDHWGLLGGALAPHRANYAELNEAKPTEVVYVCDHDKEGRSVLAPFAEGYLGKTKGISFGQDFDSCPKWDMANDLPKNLFAKNGYFIGPTLAQLMRPATWATEKIPPQEGDTRIRYRLTDAFKDEWRYSVNPIAFMNRSFPNKIYTEDSFNVKAKAFSNVMNTSRYVKKEEMQVEGLTYNPASRVGDDVGQNEKVFNTYQGPRILPATSEKEQRHRVKHGDDIPFDLTSDPKTDPTPFLTYMEHLIPLKEDRDYLLKWCATLIARPEIKMEVAVLLISEMQGVGKTTLSEKILTPLLGEWNVSNPSAQEVVESQYNSWLAHKRLTVISEIYEGKSWKAYNKLKSVITEDEINVSEKYIKTYKIKSWIHVIASSNSTKALKIQDDDRRWFVPEVTETKWTTAQWVEFNRWIREGGLPILLRWAVEHVKEVGPVMKGTSAPRSAKKDEIVDDGVSEYTKEIRNVFDDLEQQPGHEKGIIFDTDILEHVREKGRAKGWGVMYETTTDVRRIARGNNWKVGGQNSGSWHFGVRGRNSRVLSKSPILVESGMKSLEKNGVKRLKINEKM